MPEIQNNVVSLSLYRKAKAIKESEPFSSKEEATFNTNYSLYEAVENRDEMFVRNIFEAYNSGFKVRIW